ncbi:ribonuclease III [Solemya velesiana gill symbiont]|uniref:Ribonuclease 3 n=1 Tax=Solemya velesiana gill symbiont TaxID=1918948 RepID=A0A1T2KXC5_9GAMM|nr:ribonuclease III [Solemya velesiana gill symbiont]OOZ37376.1 ribonuclease III [Solemya velesiana gill symbiont]
MRESLERLCREIDYQFADLRLAERALTHRSAGSENNERLEFLGDAILGFIIADELYHRFPDADEGQLSRLRAKLVKGDSLAEISRSLELGSYLSLGAGELRSGGHSRNSILADAMEALFAAIYLDKGYENAHKVILDLFQEKLSALTAESQQKDPKTRLQEFLQARKLELPAYSITQVVGEQHNQTFTVKCQVSSLKMESEGTGSSRRKAEQDAASHLLEHLVNG